jgi:CheY-like chemotaxis protein
MSGLEAVEQLRDAGRQEFVVGVTGNAMLSDQGWLIGLVLSRILPHLTIDI